MSEKKDRHNATVWVDMELKRRLKVYAATNQVNMEECANAAIRCFLSNDANWGVRKTVRRGTAAGDVGPERGE